MVTTGQYNWVALFLLGGACVLGLAFAFAALYRPKRPSFLKRLTYESGARAQGDALVRFNIRFYIIAIVFLIGVNLIGVKEIREIYSMGGRIPMIGEGPNDE